MNQSCCYSRCHAAILRRRAIKFLCCAILAFRFPCGVASSNNAALRSARPPLWGGVIRLRLPASLATSSTYDACGTAFHRLKLRQLHPVRLERFVNSPLNMIFKPKNLD